MHRQPIRQVRIRVTGRVQGVGFRYSTRSLGESLGIDVSARNLDDGSVLIDAAGEADAIQQMIDWTHDGPPAARVDTVNVQDVRKGDTI
jgi:acylphosphatase